MPSTFQKRRPANARFARKKPSHNKPKKRGAQGEYINPSRFIKQASVSTSEVYEPTNSFADFELHELLYKNLVKKGYQTPSPIQDLAIQPGASARPGVAVR